jgi:hypothetical protein
MKHQSRPSGDSETLGLPAEGIFMLTCDPLDQGGYIVMFIVSEI